MIGRVNTGGGIKLPFRVIGGTTQPSNPKDGDIWVKTSVPIMRTEFANGTWASGGVGLVFLAGTLGGSNPTGTNTTVWAINKNTGASKYVLKIALTGCKQVQGSTGNWVILDAYRYYGGTWVQFSTAFTATINVTYPAGSTCTATDGTTTLTAPNTSGTWACVVPNTGTWTVTCTNGSSTATASVSITTDGDSKSVTLAYALPYFYDAGKFTVEWQGKGSNSGGVLTVTGGSSTANTFEGYFVIPDIHNYKTISCYISSYTNVKPTVSIRNISTGTNVASAKPSRGGSTVSLDVSSLSGNGYYFVLSTNSTWEDKWVISNVKTTKIWGDAR